MTMRERCDAVQDEFLDFDRIPERNRLMSLHKGEVDQLRSENRRLRSICHDLHWMARRYAGRSSYAPGILNDRVRELLEMGVKLNPTGDGTIWAESGSGRGCDDLSEEQLVPFDPAAKGEYVPVPSNVKLAAELNAIAKTPNELLCKWREMVDVLKALLVCFPQRDSSTSPSVVYAVTVDGSLIRRADAVLA